MPLRQGDSSSTISWNISKLIKEWETTGEINGDKINTRKEALRKATAIALSMAREKKPKPKKEE